VGHAGAPGGKRISTQNRVQPTTSDSSDQLFKIRKMRGVKVRFWCDFFFQRRYAVAGATPMHACSRSSLGGGKMGLSPRKRFQVFPRDDSYFCHRGGRQVVFKNTCESLLFAMRAVFRVPSRISLT